MKKKYLGIKMETDVLSCGKQTSQKIVFTRKAFKPTHSSIYMNNNPVDLGSAIKYLGTIQNLAYQ